MLALLTAFPWTSTKAQGLTRRLPGAMQGVHNVSIMSARQDPSNMSCSVLGVSDDHLHFQQQAPECNTEV